MANDSRARPHGFSLRICNQKREHNKHWPINSYSQLATWLIDTEARAYAARESYNQM